MLCKDTGINCLLQSSERGESANTGHVCCCFLFWCATHLLALDFLMICVHIASQPVPAGEKYIQPVKTACSLLFLKVSLSLAPASS